MPRPPLIMVTHRPPLPLDNGSRIRTHRLTTELARRCDVTLVTFHDGPTYDGTKVGREEMEAAMPGVRVELVDYGRRHPRGARRHMLRRTSASFGHYALPALRDALARLLQERPSVLQFEDPGTGLAGIGLPTPLSVFAPHNVEHRIRLEIARERPPAHRVPLEVEWRKIRAEERRLYRECDLCLAVSDIDAREMREHGARRVELAPNGTDPAEAVPWRPPRPDEPLRLLFVGTGDYWPYELGIAWFAREVMPRLREKTDVVFDVVGRRPPQRVEAPDITYHDRVPSVRPYYEAAHALVVPVFQGSGTRLKLVEASQLGRPAISTTLGAEGLPVVPDRDYFHAEDPEAFVRAALALRDDPERVRAVMAAARERLESFVWPRIADRVADIYEDALAQPQSTSTR